MPEIQLKAEKRTEFKKSIARTYRKKGFIPGIFYGAGQQSIPIAISELSLRPLIFSSEAQIVNLEIEGETKPFSCILKDVQYDPINTKPIHFDLIALREGEVITIEVNVKLVGNAPGIKEGGIIQHVLHKLQIECMPQNIPAHIDVDISNLGINDSVKVTDLKLDGIKILNDENASIVSVSPPTVVEEAKPAEVTATAEAPAEPEVISKGKKEKEEEE
jgi:large subunit ribosomal protein L25